MSIKLTFKQEMFCQEYTSNGGNASKAYRAAYNAQNMQDKTVWVKSCNLLKRDKVRVRLQEIMKPHLDEYNASRRTIMEQLLLALELGRNIDSSSMIYKSTVKLARMCGFF